MYSNLPVWAYVIMTLILTHITIASVTIFLHRHQAHRALTLHPLVSHFFRFWLWLTTGIVTKEWVAIHRKHHAKVETDNDPHSPQCKGIGEVLLRGAELYREEAKNAETLEKYGHGTPDDWFERCVYGHHSYAGIVILFIINVVLFGFIGITIWAVQMIWIPFFAAGVINGLGHWWGYRNFEPSDASTNIVPFGLLIGGEELHNNHHAFASSARFSSKWYEFDLGWHYIQLMQLLGLASVKKLAPRPVINYRKQGIDIDTLRAIVSNRLHVMSDYTRDVVSKVYKEEKAKADTSSRRLLKKGKCLLIRHESLLDIGAKKHLEEVLAQHRTLETVYEFKQRLQQIWLQKTANQESLVDALKEWCQQAELTGIQALEDFAQTLRGYTLQSAV